jgi:hypothetical protein
MALPSSRTRANLWTMDATALYDSEGRPIAYIDSDGESIYLYNGAPLAWLLGAVIYARTLASTSDG